MARVNEVNKKIGEKLAEYASVVGELHGLIEDEYFKTARDDRKIDLRFIINQLAQAERSLQNASRAIIRHM